MSTNISTGGSDVQLRTGQLSKKTQEIKPSPNEGQQSAKPTQELNSSKEIKQMEYRGENIPISDEQLVKAIERAIKAIQGPNTSLDFSVHQATKRIMVKVMDKETGAVIREVPPEKNLDLLAKLWEMAGILVDERR